MVKLTFSRLRKPTTMNFQSTAVLSSLFITTASERWKVNECWKMQKLKINRLLSTRDSRPMSGYDKSSILENPLLVQSGKSLPERPGGSGIVILPL